MRRIWKELLKVIITVSLFFYLFKKIPITEVIYKIRVMDLKFFFITVFLFFVYYLFFSFRWRYLLKSQEIMVSHKMSYLYIMISFFFNNFLPSGLGMDVVRSGYAGGKKDFDKAFGASLMERLLGMIGMMTIGMFAIFSFRINYIYLSLLYIFLMVLIGVLYYLMTSIRAEWLKKRIISIKFLKLGEFLRNFYRAIKIYKQKKNVITAGIGFSILVQIMIILINFSLSKGLHIDLPFISFIAYIPLITILSLIPITINGLGLRESAYVFLLSQLHITREAALSLSLLFLATSIIASSVGGLVFIFLRKPLIKVRDEGDINSGI